MKRSKYLIFIFVCILLIGCIPQPSTNNAGSNADINPSQKALEDIVTEFYEREDSVRNKIVEKELFNDYQSALVQFFDTAIVYDWTYYIKNLNSYDILVKGKPMNEIHFYLTSNILDVPQITFEAVYYVSPDSINTDSTYIKLKSTSDYDKVMFSGLVFKHENDCYLPDEYSSDIRFNIGHPTFRLGLLEVSKVE